jgi:hypothetical protein
MDLLVRGASFPSDRKTHTALPIFPTRSFCYRRIGPALTWLVYECILDRTGAEGAVRRPQRSPKAESSVAGQARVNRLPSRTLHLIPALQAARSDNYAGVGDVRSIGVSGAGLCALSKAYLSASERKCGPRDNRNRFSRLHSISRSLTQVARCYLARHKSSNRPESA